MLFNPVVGGKKLPALSNPAAAADIMQNKQAIDQSGQIITGTKAPLPTLTNPGSAGDLLSGKQLIDQSGNAITGTIPSMGSGNLTASGASIIVPAGYYPSQVSKSVATVTQATPSISVSSNGLITASATQSAGYVASGTKSATRQLTTQAGKTVTPSRSRQTAVSSGRYTTGTVYVAGDTNLTAANIKKGISIFGVAGTYEGESSGEYGTVRASTSGEGDEYIELTTSDSERLSKVAVVKTDFNTYWDSLMPRGTGCYIILAMYVDLVNKTVYSVKTQWRESDQLWKGEYVTDESSDFNSIAVHAPGGDLRLYLTYSYDYWVGGYAWIAF